MAIQRVVENGKTYYLNYRWEGSKYLESQVMDDLHWYNLDLSELTPEEMRETYYEGSYKDIYESLLELGLISPLSKHHKSKS